MPPPGVFFAICFTARMAMEIPRESGHKEHRTASATILSEMKMKIAFLFPGQGSQVVGMGRDLAERFPAAADTFAEADEALGFPISKMCFEGPEEELRLTEN